MIFFKSKAFDPEDFEKDLKKITNKISQNEKKLRNLKTQKQYYKKLIPLYLTSAYIIYFSFVYQQYKFKEPRVILILIASPVLIGLIFYSFLTIYNYLINSNETYMEKLKEQHTEKLNILKEKTNFDKTRDLLARFSDGEDLQELEKQAEEVRKKKEEYLRMIQEGNQSKVVEDLKKHESSKDGFYDHLLNAMLGSDEMSPENRYALVCENCLQHNGLAPPGKFPSEVRYICPRCGFINGAGKAIADRTASEDEEDLTRKVSIEKTKEENNNQDRKT